MSDDYEKPLFSKSLIKKIVAIVMIFIVAATLLATVGGAAQTVPAGYEGILLNWGQPIATLDAGFHWISPIGQQIVLVNVQTQSATAQESAASSDLQEVTTSVTVNYQVDPTFALQVYTNLRDQYETRVILPAMQDGLKASTAKYQASELITQRESAKNSFQELLQQKLSQYHINIISVSITNFKFSDQFQSAIDQKVTTEQNALAAQNQLAVVQFQAQQQVIQATANATAITVQAMGSANATVIAANATAQAVQIIQSQLTPQYIQYLYAIGWDGKLPIYWMTSGTNGTSPYLLVTIPTNTTTAPTPP